MYPSNIRPGPFNNAGKTRKIWCPPLNSNDHYLEFMKRSNICHAKTTISIQVFPLSESVSGRNWFHCSHCVYRYLYSQLCSTGAHRGKWWHGTKIKQMNPPSGYPDRKLGYLIRVYCRFAQIGECQSHFHREIMHKKQWNCSLLLRGNMNSVKFFAVQKWGKWQKTMI